MKIFNYRKPEPNGDDSGIFDCEGCSYLQYDPDEYYCGLNEFIVRTNHACYGVYSYLRYKKVVRK